VESARELFGSERKEVLRQLAAGLEAGLREAALEPLEPGMDDREAWFYLDCRYGETRARAKVRERRSGCSVFLGPWEGAFLFYAVAWFGMSKQDFRRLRIDGQAPIELARDLGVDRALAQIYHDSAKTYQCAAVRVAAIPAGDPRFTLDALKSELEKVPKRFGVVDQWLAGLFARSKKSLVDAAE